MLIWSFFSDLGRSRFFHLNAHPLFHRRRAKLLIEIVCEFELISFEKSIRTHHNKSMRTLSVLDGIYIFTQVWCARGLFWEVCSHAHRHAYHSKIVQHLQRNLHPRCMLYLAKLLLIFKLLQCSWWVVWYKRLKLLIYTCLCCDSQILTIPLNYIIVYLLTHLSTLNCFDIFEIVQLVGWLWKIRQPVVVTSPFCMPTL